MKNQKGITLIALIITIIIMLILVGVSVTVALNGGLFKTAKQASKGTEEKRDEELALSDGKVNVNGKLYNSMDEYVNGAKGEGLTTQEAVEAGLKVGDYVDYPVQYSNVATCVSTTTGLTESNYPLDSYTGWRVLSIEGEGANSYIRLVSAGVPLNYYHYDTPTKSITNLTTGFFSTPINSTRTEYNFYSCGFKDASGNAITTIDGVKTLFTNKYTQIEGTIPKVQSMTKEDIEGVLGSKIDESNVDCTVSDLLVITSKSPDSYSEVWLGSGLTEYSLWCLTCYGKMITYRSAIMGIRPVVSLSSEVKLANRSEDSWTIVE